MDSVHKEILIVVSGVSRGLGRALVDRFVEAGHTVAGCARSSRPIEELQTAYPAPHRFDLIDVSDDRQVANWAESVCAELGPPGLLINNAAVINPNAKLWEVDAEQFDRVVDVNIKGVVNVIRHFVPAMVAAQAGVIANISSGWGRSTSAEVAPYCGTKWAIEGLTKALAQELPRGMAAVPVNPGIINTEILQSCFGTSASHYPDPDEWSRIAAPFLTSLGPRQSGESVSVPV